MGRISQQSAIGTDYFLADALGSVRQLTDANGALTLIKSYSAAVGEARSSAAPFATKRNPDISAWVSFCGF